MVLKQIIFYFILIKPRCVWKVVGYFNIQFFRITCFNMQHPVIANWVQTTFFVPSFSILDSENKHPREFSPNVYFFGFMELFWYGILLLCCLFHLLNRLSPCEMGHGDSRNIFRSDQPVPTWNKALRKMYFLMNCGASFQFSLSCIPRLHNFS